MEKSRSGPLAGIDAAVLAGGFGTRISQVLGPDLPKFLAPVDGRPYAAYLFDWLAALGLQRVVLCLGHLANRIAEWIESAPLPLEIVCSIEPEPLGTAGALRHARPHLRSDPVLVLNGDSFIQADLAAFLARHRERRAPATLLCCEVPDASRFGGISLSKNGDILNFTEKKPDAGPGVISAGVYLMSAAFLDEIAAGQARSLERDIFVAQPPGRLKALSGVFPFIDIGTPDDLARATAAMLSIETTGRCNQPSSCRTIPHQQPQDENS